MKSHKQQIILNYLISSVDVFAICKGIIKPDYFNPEFKNAVKFILSYYDEYHALPSVKQIYAETELQLEPEQLTSDKIEYCCVEVEKHCKRKAMEAAILNAIPLIAKEDFGAVEQSVRDALLVSLNKDLGLNYFDDPNTRLENALSLPPRTSTLWNDFDEAIGGGLARTELLLVTANSGGGKSITLANLALNFLSQGLSVLYISLELSEDMIAQRFDTMYTSIPTVAWRNHYKDIANTITDLSKNKNVGGLMIKRMPTGTNSNTIRAYIKEFELKYGYAPDLLVVDYLDLMGANEHVSADNISEKDKRATEQLRDILFDYNMFGATASQQNRAAIDAPEIHQGHIAGGITKVNTVDIHASIILTPTMKAAGELMFKFLKTRSSDGVGKTISMRWDNRALRIYNSNRSSSVDEDGVIIDKIAEQKSNKKSLLDLMNL